MNISDFSQKPTANVPYAKNEVPAFVITTNNTLLAILSIGNETVFQGSYAPDFDGQITIDFAGLYDKYLETLIPSSQYNQLTHTNYCRLFTATFYVLVGEDTAGEPATLSWYVANARLRSSSPFRNWSKHNFLTNMPLEKVTNYESPEWISWFDMTGASTLDVRFYPKSGGSFDVTVFTVSSSGCYSVNVRYSRLIQMANVLSSSLKGYYDLILYDAKNTEVCRQRYIYEERSGLDKYFLFVNALGGIDTLICSGANTLSPEMTHNIGRFSDGYHALDDTDEQRKWTQSTGKMPNKYRNWVYELLAEKQGAQKYDPAAMAYYEIVVDQSDVNISDFGQLAEASFGYILNETVNVMLDTERAVDRSLHQSVADEAEEMDDLSVSEMAVFEDDGQGGFVTDELEISATKIYVTDPRILTTAGEAAIYYFLNGSQTAAGSFTPGEDDNPFIITKTKSDTISFATQNDKIGSLIVSYYPTSIS